MLHFVCCRWTSNPLGNVSTFHVSHCYCMWYDFVMITYFQQFANIKEKRPREKAKKQNEKLFIFVGTCFWVVLLFCFVLNEIVLNFTLLQQRVFWGFFSEFSNTVNQMPEWCLIQYPRGVFKKLLSSLQ